MTTNGYGINNDSPVIFVGDKGYDFFLFNSQGQFEPTIEELYSGEIRADDEDEEDDKEEELGGYFIPNPGFEPNSEQEQQPTLKLELSINLNISINGESIFSNQFPNQLGCSGLDSNLGARS